MFFDFEKNVGVINKLDRRRVLSTTRFDLPWRNFLSLESGTKFQREVLLFSETAAWHKYVWKGEAPVPKQRDLISRFDRSPTYNGHRQTETLARTELA